MTNVANQINSFIKQFSLIVINSRIDLNPNRKYISNNLFGVSQKETFDIDDMFNLQEEYTFLSSPLNTNSSNKTSYVIEIYLNCDKKPLIERWVLTCMQPNELTVNKNYFNKKLNTLIRSCYFITRVLPAYSYHHVANNKHRDNLYEFKVFKHKLNSETSFTSLQELKCCKIGPRALRSRFARSLLSETRSRSPSADTSFPFEKRTPKRSRSNNAQ